MMEVVGRLEMEEIIMTINIKDVKIDLKCTRHANYQIGAVFTWSDGHITYGEFKSVSDAIDYAINKENNV